MPMLPGHRMMAFNGSTAVSSAAVPAPNVEPSSGQTAVHKASTEELPLWVETKTAEGKVS